MNIENMYVRFENISKNFQSVQALKDVSFDIKLGGEVMALVGENGAGKSTLIKIMTGVHKPSKGRFFINGEEVSFNNTRDAANKGISAIYQELDLIPQLNGVENMFLGFELKSSRFHTLDKRKMQSIARENLEKMQSKIDLKKPVGSLPIAEQQIVAILKALVHKSIIILMDEPSSSLSSNELENLYELIRNLKRHKTSVIYISHRIEEIFEIADTVTVMRDGQYISTDKIAEVTKEEIIEKMIGRQLKDERINLRKSLDIEDNYILTLNKIEHKNTLKNIDFKVKKGEIFGVLGLIGSGSLDLAKILSGITKPTHGEIILNGKPIFLKSPYDAINNSISYVPNERRTQGLFFNLNVLINSMIMSMGKFYSSRIGLVKRKEMSEAFGTYREVLNMKISSLTQLVGELSGGNQQKIVFAKCMAMQTDIIVLNGPTKGIDVGSKYEIYQLLIKLSEQGKTIIVFSTEIPELSMICDRIMILKKGRVSKFFESQEINQEKIFKELLS